MATGRCSAVLAAALSADHQTNYTKVNTIEYVVYVLEMLHLNRPRASPRATKINVRVACHALAGAASSAAATGCGGAAAAAAGASAAGAAAGASASAVGATAAAAASAPRDFAT